MSPSPHWLEAGSGKVPECTRGWSRLLMEDGFRTQAYPSLMGQRCSIPTGHLPHCLSPPAALPPVLLLLSCCCKRCSKKALLGRRPRRADRWLTAARVLAAELPGPARITPPLRSPVRWSGAPWSNCCIYFFMVEKEWLYYFARQRGTQ